MVGPAGGATQIHVFLERPAHLLHLSMPMLETTRTKADWIQAILSFSCIFAVAGAGVELTFAAPQKSKDRIPAVAPVAAPQLPSGQNQPSAQKAASTAAPGESQPRFDRGKKERQTEPEPSNRKLQRQVKLSKKPQRKAQVEPKPDLTYHGLIEDTQRYDPRLNHRTAGIQNPQTPDLAQDHFQELDRNLDGRVDPIERAFGRIDMDRDLTSRRR